MPNTKIVFWMNDLSIHILPLLEKLCVGGYTVSVFHEQDMIKDRKEQGWESKQYPFSFNKINTKKDVVVGIESLLTAHHVFYGIRSYPLVGFACKYAQQRGLDIGLFLEKPDLRGLKGFLRKIKYLWLARTTRYRYLLTPGGKEFYSSVGFDKEKVHSFSYATFNDLPSIKRLNDITHIAFIGFFIPRKNAGLLLDAVNGISLPYRLTLMGGGPEILNLKKQAEAGRIECSIITPIPHAQIADFLMQCDILVLPSLHDGYGVVAAEAAVCGCRVLVSDGCGVCEIAMGRSNVVVFRSNDVFDLRRCLVDFIKKGPLTFSERKSNEEKSVELLTSKSTERWLHILTSQGISE